MSKKDKIKQIRKLCGVTTELPWAKLCSLTEFDSFATAFAFGLQWNENCPNDRLITMNEKFINMILFNVINFPKQQTPDTQEKE